MSVCYSYSRMKQWVIGIDEVGRGPLAGPVCVCGVAIPSSIYRRTKWSGLTDSKQMTKANRELWSVKALKLKEEGGIKIGIAYQSAAAIDTKGISACIRLCIASVLRKLDIDPSDCTVLLDGGLKAPQEYLFQETIIKGDSKEKAISLASVVAKVARDAKMNTLHKTYPVYGWNTNKGYGTKAHISGIKKHGVTPLHRKSFLTQILDK